MSIIYEGWLGYSLPVRTYAPHDPNNNRQTKQCFGWNDGGAGSKPLPIGLVRCQQYMSSRPNMPPAAVCTVLRDSGNLCGSPLWALLGAWCRLCSPSTNDASRGGASTQGQHIE